MNNDASVNPDFAAQLQGITLALGFLIVTLSKHPGVDTGLLLADWKEMTGNTKKQTPQQVLPGAYLVLKQFEDMIKSQVRPDSSNSF